MQANQSQDVHRSFQERERHKEEAISKILQKTAQEKAAGACRLLKFCMKSMSSLFLTIKSERLRVPVNPPVWFTMKARSTV